jgi:glycosyltransferase involved in cell wall biosynthesis
MTSGPRTPTSSTPGRRLAMVIWNGQVGGAQVMTVTLAEHMLRLGASPTIVFVGTPWPLAERLVSRAIPFRALGLARGRDVLRRSRRYAAEINRTGPDGALVVERGFMGATLRAGGYRGPIVAVEHGALLLEQRESPSVRRLSRQISRATGARAVDAEVAVSDFMLERMLEHTHARQVTRIYNGVDPDTYLAIPKAPIDHATRLTVGFAGRLIPGKGADRLIQACAQMSLRYPVRLLIAGDGPERSRLSSLAQSLGADTRIEFLGVIHDVPALWQRCDIVAVPPDTLIEESFSMVTLEAMACGMPIVATRNGGIPELIDHGTTGTLVTPGDVEGLADALVTYAEQPELRREHGAAARARAIDRFHIDASAQAYIDLFSELALDRHRKA